MPVKARWSIDIPKCSFPTYLLGSPSDTLDNQRPQFLEAADPTRCLSRASFRLWSQRLAAGLKTAGLKRGDRVLLFSANDLFFPVVFMGVIMAGGIFTGANPSFTSRELAYQLKDSDASFLLCHEVVLDVGIQAADSLGFDKNKLYVFNGEIYNGQPSSHQGCRNWADLVASEKEGKDFVWDDLRAPDACHATLALNYSSGTTGVPKGVEITHYNYIANTEQMVFINTLRGDWKQNSHRYAQLCYLPLYHAMAQTLFIANAMRVEIPVYIMPKFDFVQMLQYVEKYRITFLTMVPPVIVAMTKHPIVKTFDLSHVMYASSGAAPLGRKVVAELEALFPASQNVNLKQGWGMTETTCSILGWDASETCTNSSVGEPNPNCEIAIMPASSEATLNTFDPCLELPRNTRGELWARGPNIMKGYWRNPSATAATLTSDGWLKTGDICYVDDRNHVFVVDRIKELIKVKGHQVPPAELEAILLEHISVADVAVIGIPDDETGDEKVKAVVVKAPNSKDVEGEEIVKWMNDRVAKYKWLTGGIRFVESIPKNASGKILRRSLRESESQEMEKEKKWKSRVEGPRL